MCVRVEFFFIFLFIYIFELPSSKNETIGRRGGAIAARTSWLRGRKQRFFSSRAFKTLSRRKERKEAGAVGVMRPDFARRLK